jgi:glyceraldehyde 3-phosphate dehydrogenase (phosphorylating)
MKAVRAAINGLGRTGRNTLRCIYPTEEIEVVAVNDLTSAEELAHLIRHDSVHGRYTEEVTHQGNTIEVSGHQIRVFAEKDPAKLPWKSLGVDVVLESTGKFRAREDASKHLAAGARRVLISAPGKKPDWTVVLGVNDKEFDPDRHRIISNASCTTNCAAPVAKVLDDAFGIERGLLTTVHSFTNDQRLLDLPHKDLRRARAASLSMIPTTTGAAVAVTEVLPRLSGRLDGVAIRVPTPDVSIVDLTVELQRDATGEAVTEAFRKASEGPLAGVLGVTEEPLVSVDYVGDHRSAIVDLPLTRMVGSRFVKVFAWYDNEVGYSARCRDVLQLVGSR